MTIRFKLATIITRTISKAAVAAGSLFVKEKSRATALGIKKASKLQQRVEEVKRETEIQYANLEQAMAEELAAVEQRYKLKQDAIEMQNVDAKAAVDKAIKQLEAVRITCTTA
ncbi:hypothetical protein VPH526E571_0024 [Vibrio phage 526E57-1]